MSAADDAYTEFWESKGFPAPSSGPDRAAFMFAYRRALEDAADAANLHRQVPKSRDDLDGFCQDDECLWWDMTYALRDELRDRAAGVGTKGGADECGCDSTAGILLPRLRSLLLRRGRTHRMMTLILVVFACKVLGLVALGRWLFRPGGAFDRLETGL